MRINRTSLFSDIKLAEGQPVPKEVQVLRVGKFTHPKYGNFEITPLTLSEMKSNFDNRVRGVDVSFDYYHESDKDAAAWVGTLELRENGTELWAINVDWTPTAERKLSERALRYFSPDFAFKWTDPEKGVEYKNVLFGGGLTNRPFVKEMQAIVADEKQGEEMTELEKAQARVKELEAANVKLSDQYAGAEKKMADMVPKPAPGAAAEESDEVKSLKSQISALQAQLQKAQGDADMALAEKKKADEAKMLAEKTTEFNVLLSEGKACAAQKDAFLKDDMKEFVKLAEKPNLNGSGVSTSDHVQLAEGDANGIIKLAEEKRKADPKMSVADSLKQAKREFKK